MVEGDIEHFGKRRQEGLKCEEHVTTLGFLNKKYPNKILENYSVKTL